jgi:hypothetical protein
MTVRDVAPWEDELREAARDAREASVFFDAPADRPTSSVEVSQDEADTEWGGAR